MDRLQAKQPDKPAAANLRGRIYLAQKDTVAARKSFEQALKIDPTYFAAAASLATLDMAEKKPADARRRFEALLAINPKNAQALQALAALAAANGAGKDEVAGWLNKAVEANPSEAAPRLLLIDLLLRNKDTKQALAAAQSGVTAMPNSPEMLTALGRAQQMSGELSQAIATYNKLVALQPLSPVPHVRLAEAHVANKDKKAAEQSLRKALEIKPDFLDAQRGLILLAVDDEELHRSHEDRPHRSGAAARSRPRASSLKAISPTRGRTGMPPRGLIGLRCNRARHRRSRPSCMQSCWPQARVQMPRNSPATWQKEHPKDAVFLAYQGQLALSRKGLRYGRKALPCRAEHPARQRDRAQ